MSTDILVAVVSGLWLMLPAYAANPMAVIFGGGAPIDLGATLGDGRRLLGDGKTWRGLVGGVASGTLLGLILIALSTLTADPGFSFGATTVLAVCTVFLLALGSLLGDLLGSFVKRRLGRERGAKMAGLDQYDFLLGAWLLIIIFRWDWFYAGFVEGWGVVSLVTVVLVTPALHRAVNILGHRMGKKDVPW